MLSSSKQLPTNTAVTQQVRHFSRRRLAYPFYQTPQRGRTDKKDHTTTLRYQMGLFFGDKNYKGEYPQSKYFNAPQDHQPNYIAPDLERGVARIDINTGKPVDLQGRPLENPQTKRPNRKLMPFPNNEFCQTNLLLSNEDREEIFQRIVVDKVPIQEVAVNFGIKIPRLEAVVRLKHVEKKWEAKNKVTPELKKMSTTMYKMFPLFERPRHSDNLSEIPVPVKTLQSRFLTIAESEPFGPVDAAKVFGLEPASETLSKLAETGHIHTKISSQKSQRETFTAKSEETDRYVFKFHKAKVGQVGFRYGTTNRDNKKDRKFTYGNDGKMVNALPLSG